VRGLHHTSSIEVIKAEIGEHILHPVTKSPLPLFFVESSPQTNIKKVYNINILLNSRVDIEDLHEKIYSSIP
jgi:hypothetical protein